MSRPRTASLILAAFLGVLAMTTAQAGLVLHVSAQGSDQAAGTVRAPFATLERARDEIRALRQADKLPPGGVVVEVAGGVYEFDQAFTLTAEDSGTAGAPVTYRAAPGAEVRLVGGREVTNFQPVSDPEAVQRLDPAVRGKVYQADLRAIGITDFGDVVNAGRRLELFFRDEPMQPARWPNEGFAKIVEVVGGAPHKIHGIPGDKIGRFTYDGDRPARWLGEKDLWLHGYWFWDWAEQYQQVEAIDTEKRVISLKPPYHGYGYRNGAWWYAINALAELDAPGEWYLDHETGTLYFYPPAPLSQGKCLVSVIPTLITMENVSHVVIQGFILEACRGTALTMSGGTRNKVVGCVIRNTGASAVNISGGTDNGVIGCDVYNQAAGGIHLSGGDRPSLTPCGNYADNNHVHHYARWNRVYNPGITLNGVGCVARNNLIDNAPHMAMGFGGNDHLIEYNEIHSVCYESNDAGAIYTGRDWSMWGTVLRHNYLHHINGREGKGCVGMYLDDQFSGTQMYGNLFYKVTRAAMIGGGRYCTIENNIFVDCEPATHVDARGLGWAAGGFQGLKDKLEALPYKGELWARRYPQLVNTLDENPMAPVGNVIARNICVGGRWGDFEASAKPLITFIDNLVGEDPHFVDAANLNFNLRPDSPALKLGFKPLPLGKIGLYQSPARASWPVHSVVREMETPPTAPAVQRPPQPTARVTRRVAAVTVDGSLDPAEWGGLEPAKGLVLEQGFGGEKITPRSLVWVTWDDEALYVAFDNAVNPKFPIRPGNRWGQDDAVEVALRVDGDPAAPILVWRGFPSGQWVSSEEAGASPEAARRAAAGVQYAAKIVDGKRWTCEFRLPWASAGIAPARQRKLQANFSVRKTADDQWVEWYSTLGCTWEVEKAGRMELIP